MFIITHLINASVLSQAAMRDYFYTGCFPTNSKLLSGKAKVHKTNGVSLKHSFDFV